MWCEEQRVSAPRHGGKNAAERRFVQGQRNVRQSEARFVVHSQDHAGLEMDWGGLGGSGAYQGERGNAAGVENAQTPSTSVKNRSDCGRGNAPSIDGLTLSSSQRYWLLGQNGQIRMSVWNLFCTMKNQVKNMPRPRSYRVCIFLRSRANIFDVLFRILFLIQIRIVRFSYGMAFGGERGSRPVEAEARPFSGHATCRGAHHLSVEGYLAHKKTPTPKA